MLSSKKPAINDPFLRIGLEAVAAAEKVILKYFNHHPEILIKDDNSPVTIADKEAEQIIQKIIASKFPEHNFLGEESGSSNSKSEYTWIIDPIDGTKAFLRGLPQFSTLLALQKNQEIILGISYLPIFKELLYAVKHKGAYLNHQVTQVSAVEEISEAYSSVGTLYRFEQLGKVDSLLKLDKKVRYQRALGDSYHFHLLASGKIDIVMEAKGNIWDWAAFEIICQEARGVVTQIDGSVFDNQARSILASNKYLHPQVVEYFK